MGGVGESKWYSGIRKNKFFYETNNFLGDSNTLSLTNTNKLFNFVKGGMFCCLWSVMCQFF